MRLVRCLLSELDAAGHTYALETPLLLSSDGITADVELGQCPHIGDGIGNSNNTSKAGAWWGVVLLFIVWTIEKSIVFLPALGKNKCPKIVIGQIQGG